MTDTTAGAFWFAWFWGESSFWLMFTGRLPGTARALGETSIVSFETETLSDGGTGGRGTFGRVSEPQADNAIAAARTAVVQSRVPLTDSNVSDRVASAHPH
ncbi:MAG: hypothetical protein IPK93_12190 [Solirubrobacterales bacterium]|nr:hypothetical protein [Solirubrobacterales bacterium]